MTISIVPNIVGKMFFLDRGVVRLDSRYEALISTGQLCFSDETLPLLFELKSDKLKTVERVIDIEV